MTKLVSILPLATLLLFGATATAQDSDQDGVPDATDAYPCDPTLAGEAFAPAEGVWGQIMFEDEWPLQGDLDFDDIVFAYQAHLKMDGAGNTSQAVLHLEPMALGGERTFGLGLQLPGNKANVSSVQLSVDGGPAQALSMRAADSRPTVTIANDLRTFFGGQIGPINSIEAQPHLSGSGLTITITYSTPSALDPAAAPFDLFVFRTDKVGHEIHTTNYAGTAAMDNALFGANDDGSSPGRYFVDFRGLPFGLTFPEIVAYPKEGVDIALLYPRILNFAASAGALDADFYLGDTQLTHAYRGALPTVANPPAPAAPSTSCVPSGSGLRAAVLADNPSAYWPLDETSGAVAYDVSGNNRHGTYRGGVVVGQAGLLGPAPNFTNGGYVTTGVNLSALMSASEGTVTAVAQMPSAYYNFGSGYPGHVSHQVWSSWAWYQGLSVGHHNGVSGVHAWSFYTGSNDHRVSRAVPAGSWVHLAWVKTGGRLYIYVNGVASSVSSSQNMASMGEINIGRRHQGSTYGTTYPGLISHVATFPTGLSAARIAAHARAAGL